MKVTQAAQMNKVRGNLPAGIEKLIENILYPKLDWKQALASFVQPTRFDYTFLPPDRRFDYVFLPEFGSEGLENIVVALDTSGSVWNYATEFMSELIGIVHSYPDFKGYVAMCDTKTVFDELTPDYTPKKFIGGGGTNFRSLFEKVDNYGIDPSLMVFLTDGKALFPKIPPNYPVLWVLINENCPTPPFGSVAYMNLD
jgi:predicted metal-dependent peptidase